MAEKVYLKYLKNLTNKVEKVKINTNNLIRNCSNLQTLTSNSS